MVENLTTTDALRDPQVRVVERALTESGVVIARWQTAARIVEALRASGDMPPRA